jgi:hypothetical protein
MVVDTVLEHEGQQAVLAGELQPAGQEQDFPPEELYDVQEDPAERNNLAGDPQHEDERKRLSGLVDEWMKETDDPLLKGPIPLQVDNLIMHKAVLPRAHDIVRQQMRKWGEIQ